MGLFDRNLPPGIAERVPPGNHLARGWPVLHYAGPPSFEESTWDLKASGLCEDPFSLSYAGLKALPNVKVAADFHCVTGWSALDFQWEGVSFRTLAELARPLPEARWVMAICEYGYTSNLSLEAMLDDDVLVAWAKDGQPLAPDHGFPLRLVVPKRYAWKSAKWLRGFEFMADNARGFWEVRGYHTHADPWGEERYSYQEGPGAETEL